MNVTVRITSNFKKAIKPLLKRYASLSDDLLRLQEELKRDPRQGTPLGQNAYKIRLKISSKGKGKSGGASVISLVNATLIKHVQITGDDVTVELLTIYDKADTDNISDKELRGLITDAQLE